MSAPSTPPIPSDALRELLPPALSAMLVPLQLRSGERLFHQKQRPRHMYFVMQGELVLERVGAHGASTVLQRVRHGFIAEASLQAASYHCDARVTNDALVLGLPLDELRAALASDPQFALRWIRMLNSEVRRLRAHCERLSLRGVADRLLHALETEGVDGRLAIPAGLKSLANELAVTHEALYRIVAALERDKLVVREAGFICLQRP